MAERRKQKNLKDFALGTDKGNPVVFLDISINGEAIKRMYIEVMQELFLLIIMDDLAFERHYTTN